MSRKPYTGGPLRILNGKAAISAPQNSVPVSGLLRAHNPKSALELEQLISDHRAGNCSCGIRSKGTVQDFGRNLFNAQMKHWGENRFTLDECVQWEYDLFIRQMLKGSRMEDKCKTELSKLLPAGFTVQDTNTFADENLRVDLEVVFQDRLVAGIQVKPASYKNTQPGVKAFNANANKKYRAPVLYITYEYDSEALLDLSDTVGEIVLLADGCLQRVM